MKKPGGGQALLFEKPTVNGQLSPFPLAINAFGSHKRMAMSLGADSVEQIAAELGSLLNAKPPTSFRQAISLLGSAFIHLAWLGLVGPELWWASAISLVYAFAVFRQA